MTDITLHDLARDIAEVVKQLGGGRAVIVGHAYGNWVAPDDRRGPPATRARRRHRGGGRQELCTGAEQGGDQRGQSRSSDEERLAALRFAFFAPGNDPAVWLKGWHPEIRDSQRAAAAAVRQRQWWSGGSAPLLDLQAAEDPFKPEAKRNEMKDEFGHRVTVM